MSPANHLNAMMVALVLVLTSFTRSVDGYERQWGLSAELAPTYRYYKSPANFSTIDQHGVGATALVSLRYAWTDWISLMAELQVSEMAFLTSDTLPERVNPALGAAAGIVGSLPIQRTRWRLGVGFLLGAGWTNIPVRMGMDGPVTTNQVVYFSWTAETFVSRWLARDLEIAIYPRVGNDGISNFQATSVMMGIRLTYIWGY